MNIGFSTDNPVDSVVSDNATGQRLYAFSTPTSQQLFGHATTTMRDAQGRVVATRQTHLLQYEEVTYQGQTMKVSDWLVSKSYLAMSRIFVAPNGRSYEWNLKSGADYTLTDGQTGQIVARGARSRTKLFSSSSQSRLSIDVSPDGLPILEAIVLSFVLCEMTMRRQERSSGG